jgi:hypothetical protein
MHPRAATCQASVIAPRVRGSPYANETPDGVSFQAIGVSRQLADGDAAGLVAGEVAGDDTGASVGDPLLELLPQPAVNRAAAMARAASKTFISGVLLQSGPPNRTRGPATASPTGRRCGLTTG